MEFNIIWVVYLFNENYSLRRHDGVVQGVIGTTGYRETFR